ncbi:MAG: two-component regulator propeller domain-containing protein [Bacillota bacterium]
MPSRVRIIRGWSRRALRCLAISILALLPVLPGYAAPRFRHLSMEDGLSNNEVKGFVQDSQGYLWISTGDGLNRYDGYTFKIFRHNQNDPSSLSGNYIRSICEDKQGRLWIAPFPNGLDLYDPQTETFRHFRHVTGDPNSLISDSVDYVAVLADGRLLVNTSDAGFDILDPSTDIFRHYPTGSSPAAPADGRVSGVFVDNLGRFWIATPDGLDRFDPAKNVTVFHLDNPAKDLRSHRVWQIAEDASHRLWVTTYGGVYVYDPDLLHSSQTPTLRPGPKALQKMLMRSVFVDDKQNIWFTTITNGIFVMLAGSGELRHYKQVVGAIDTLASNNTNVLFEDHAGLMWLGTYAGISTFDPEFIDIYSLKPSEIKGNRNYLLDTVTALLLYGNKLLMGGTGGVYQFDLNSNTDELSDSHNVFLSLDLNHYGQVLAIVRTGEKNLLMTTASGNLLLVDPLGRILKTWLPASDIAVKRDPANRILLRNPHEAYLATFGGGLLLFDTQTSKTRQIAGTGHNELGPTDVVEDLLQVGPGYLWAGTFRGLFLVDMRSQRSTLIPMTPGNIEPVVQSLYEDPQHVLWVGTYEGLWRIPLDAAGKPLSPPVQVPPLKHTQVLAIEPDDAGNLWLATVNSLLRFEPSRGVSLSFARDQGSPMSEYYSYGHTHSPNGWLWFSGGQGAIGFRPQDLKPNSHPPEVVLSGVTSYRDGQQIPMLLPPGKELTLGYKDAISIFDAAAMDFGAPVANTYSYRLVGFQSDWTPPTPSHLITFTNLNPGRYRLEVRAANNWGVWSAVPAKLDINVLPPWWRTWWAYTVYLLVTIGSAIAYVYSLKRKIEREKQVSASLREANEIKSNFVEKLEVQVKEATQELRETLQGVNLKNAELEVAQRRAAEGEKVKSQFLANMSHELRTPLTGVLGYTKLLGSTQLNSEQKDYVGTIRQSSETLLAIINDTLDLSRLEAGKLLIDEVDFDLLELIESTLELLAPIAYQKRLELMRVIPSDVPLQLRGDPLRVRQVLTNLLSNAIKFTESGSICIRVEAAAAADREANLTFSVIDTGIGIPEGEIGQLFNAYARGKISARHQVEGTGLGLAICRKLIDLMGGQIEVKSRVGSGTTFRFQLKFRVQKNATARVRLSSRLRIALYDRHPLSSQAWCASLSRLGAEVHEVLELDTLISSTADAVVLSLSEHELAELSVLKNKFARALPPMLILAPRIERQTLKDLSEMLYHRVLSKSAREKTVYLELQSLVQRVIQPAVGQERTKGPEATVPASDAPLILVADDNRINRRLLVTMLNQAGYRTLEAGSGNELLDAASRARWDAALLDIHMPGMDGIETASALRAAYGNSTPPIIAMSADVLPEGRGQISEGLMDDFLMKPFNEQQLMDLLREHVERHSRRQRDPA